MSLCGASGIQPPAAWKVRRLRCRGGKAWPERSAKVAGKYNLDRRKFTPRRPCSVFPVAPTVEVRESTTGRQGTVYAVPVSLCPQGSIYGVGVSRTPYSGQADQGFRSEPIRNPDADQGFHRCRSGLSVVFRRRPCAASLRGKHIRANQRLLFQ